MGRAPLEPHVHLEPGCEGKNRLVTGRIHDDEPDTSEPIVRALLESECSRWSNSPVHYLETSGTDNAMWRVRLDDEPDVVVRLPRRPGAAAGVSQEMVALKEIAHSRAGSMVKTPTVRHVGEPHEFFPHQWSVLEWLDGEDAWTLRNDLGGRELESLAADLGDVVAAIGEITGLDVRPRLAGSRGGPLEPLLDRLNGWLNNPEWNAASLVDVAAVKRLVAESLEVVDEPVNKGFVHGDLIPGNLLLDDGVLTAVIDWGGAGIGDIAQDLAPAWDVLTSHERQAFREAVGADDATWIRGRAFELEHAVGGVLYYAPRRHSLGDVMARTLDRILTNR